VLCPGEKAVAVSGAYHEWHQIIAETEKDGHDHEKYPRGAVQGEQPVENLRREEMRIGMRQLNAHQERFNSHDNQKQKRVDDVHQPDLLMVGRSQPLVSGRERAFVDF
jgi:hypothetical protein